MLGWKSVCPAIDGAQQNRTATFLFAYGNEGLSPEIERHRKRTFEPAIGKPSPLVGLADGLAHEIGSDRLIVGRHAPHEHFPVRALGPLVLEICSDGMPRRHWQGQDLLASVLGLAQREYPGFPIDIVERETAHVFHVIIESTQFFVDRCRNHRSRCDHA